ncbi:hypothetical protein [Oscillatoria sp. FACHB-1407]|nr:hypothetical protein [Oscillatoria sp. FACHB-1407]
MVRKLQAKAMAQPRCWESFLTHLRPIEYGYSYNDATLKRKD